MYLQNTCIKQILNRIIIYQYIYFFYKYYLINNKYIIIIQWYLYYSININSINLLYILLLLRNIFSSMSHCSKFGKLKCQIINNMVLNSTSQICDRLNQLIHSVFMTSNNSFIKYTIIHYLYHNVLLQCNITIF